MKSYYLVVQEECEDYMSVCDYDIGEFEIYSLWQGKILTTPVPPGARLYVESSSATPFDYLGNPLSWPICSDRLTDVILAKAPKDIQLFDAPLFDIKTKRPIPGYKIVNVLKAIECLDLQKSDITWSDDGSEIESVHKCVFSANRIPDDAHIFRPAEWHYYLIFSDKLVQEICSQEFRGIDFIQCRST
jgi:hypothetical protein